VIIALNDFCFHPNCDCDSLAGRTECEMTPQESLINMLIKCAGKQRNKRPHDK
jgi:hypothetical protein